MCQHRVTHRKVTALALAPVSGREPVLEPGTNSLCHVLLGEKFKHANLGSKHRLQELRCSPRKED